MKRAPEPEVMGSAASALAYARADFAAVNAAFVARLLELARGAEPMRLLDLGAGPGDIPIRIVTARRRWRVTAVDASLAMLRLARRALGPSAPGRRGVRVHLVLSDVKRAGLASGAFDVVLGNSILHHVASPMALWREVRRLGRPGALVFMRDLYRPPSVAHARAIVGHHSGRESALLRREFLESLMSSYRPGEVRAQLARAGLGGLRVSIVSDRHMDIVGHLPPGSP